MDSAALFAGAVEDFKRGFHTRAHTRLQQAAMAGHPGAQLMLARHRATFLGPLAAQDAELCNGLEKAIANGSLKARSFRATLQYLSGNKEQALEDLNQAAMAGHPAAQTALGLLWLEHDGEESAHIGRAWLARAVQSGDRLALILKRAGLFPQAVEPSAIEVRILEQWAEQHQAPEWKSLCAAPSIQYVDGLLSPLECGWLRIMARPELQASLIVDPVTKQPKLNPMRTSFGMNFGLPPDDLIIARLVERMARHAGLAAENAEPLAVLRYLPGEQYHAHRDALGAEKLAQDPLARSGDRARTALVYLNEPRAGGATVFPQLDIKVTPRSGRLLVFANTTMAGIPDDQAVHIGAPVMAGRKWLASLWLRERSVAASAPAR